MSTKITLTAEQEARFRFMWGEGMRVTMICETFRITHDTANGIRIRLGLPARTPTTRAKPGEQYRDPTPEEIAQRAAAVRATWTPEVEERRRVGWRNRQYEFPTARVDDVFGARS